MSRSRNSEFPIRLVVGSVAHLIPLEREFQVFGQACIMFSDDWRKNTEFLGREVCTRIWYTSLRSPTNAVTEKFLMPDETSFDTAKFAALLVQENITRLVDTAKNVTGTTVKGIEAKLRSSYSAYILAAADHYGTARTFFIRDERKPLYNYYVPLEICSGNSTLPNASVKKLAAGGLRAIVAGKAGCGKSTLMRHLFLDSIKDGKRIPIFVELNQLNDWESVDLWELVFNSFKKHGLKLTQKQVEDALRRGGFTILFDGLDEVEDSLKNETVKQVAQFSSEASDNLVVVSSRPDESYAALKAFNLYEVQPLSLTKAVSLVKKLPFDEEIRAKFALELKRSLYEQHTSFLSNPLLLSIMLLTYGQSASIPNKICVFYNQAYEALFQTHDAYKGGYSRKRLTNLDIREFDKAFSAFCLLSYDASAYSFSRTECLDFMEKAKKISQEDFSPNSLMRDCLQSVNLLMEDGLKVTFVHRSFQEYFAAKYASRLDDVSKAKLLDRFGKRSRTDNVLDLFWELDRRSLEDLWLIPKLMQLRKSMDVKQKVGITHYTRYVKHLFGRLSCVQHREGDSSILLSYRGTADSSESIRNAMWLAYFRYYVKPKQRPNSGKDNYARIKRLMPSEKKEIKTKDLKTRSDLTRALADSGGVLSMNFVQLLADLPTEIEKQRAKESESLESILGLG